MSSKINIGIGFLGLLVGLLIYLSQGSTNYINQSLNIFVEIDFAKYLGSLRGPLPEFIHPFSFTLIGLGLFGQTKTARISIFMFMLLSNLLFELGQKYKSLAVVLIPDFFSKLPILENAKAFFLNGTYSNLDIIAVILGSFTALILFEFIPKKGVEK